jgi:hypothetical protein
MLNKVDDEDIPDDDRKPLNENQQAGMKMSDAEKKIREEEYFKS